LVKAESAVILMCPASLFMLHFCLLHLLTPFSTISFFRLSSPAPHFFFSSPLSPFDYFLTALLWWHFNPPAQFDLLLPSLKLQKAPCFFYSCFELHFTIFDFMFIMLKYLSCFGYSAHLAQQFCYLVIIFFELVCFIWFSALGYLDFE
jgi:hypothetical protein